MQLSGIVKSLSRSILAVTLCAQIAGLPLLGGAAHADFVATAVTLNEMQPQYDQARLRALLEHQDVQQKLISMGVDMDAAKQRVNHLSAAEISQLNTQIETLPAGAGIVGIAVLFTVIFIFTDVIGATDIFPFIKSINKK